VLTWFLCCTVNLQLKKAAGMLKDADFQIISVPDEKDANNSSQLL
jgi:hypothetical protein